MLHQPIIRDETYWIGGYHHGDTFIHCAKCGKEVASRGAYFDPYHRGGSQVHKDCLSDQRKQEIEEELSSRK